MTEFWPPEYAELDFELPENLIATEPAEPADSARLMVVSRQTGTITHDTFANLGNYLASGDAIYYNATRVEARRVRLKRADGDAQYECVFLQAQPGTGPGQTWQVLMRNVRRLKDGAELIAVGDATYRFRLSRHEEKLLLSTERHLGAEDFARVVLAEGLGIAHVVVGSDFCFGKGRTGTAADLRDLGNRFAQHIDIGLRLDAALGQMTPKGARAGHAVERADEVPGDRV